MRKLIFIASILAMVGFSITSCNKEEELVTSESTNLKTTSFDHVKYINDFKAKHQDAIDAFYADGFVLTYENEDDYNSKPIVSFVDEQSESSFFGWLDKYIEEYNKICKGGYSYQEIHSDCHKCKMYYFGCENSAGETRFFYLANDIFVHNWQQYKEETKGEPLPNWVHIQVFRAMELTSYPLARQHILENLCQCE